MDPGVAEGRRTGSDGGPRAPGPWKGLFHHESSYTALPMVLRAELVTLGSWFLWNFVINDLV